MGGNILSNFPELTIELSLRQDGGMKFGDNSSTKNRQEFLRRIGIDESKVVSAALTHSSNVQVVSSEDVGKIYPNTDGLITNAKNLFLSVTVADCLPIVLYEPHKKIFAVVHAGWRGLAAGILKKTLQKMVEEFSADVKEISLSVGPSIGQCHYDVKEDVTQHFFDYPSVILQQDEKTFLNIKEVARQQVLELGLQKEHIEVSPICTFCEAGTHFSHRKDQSAPVQAMMLVAGIREVV